MKKSTIRFIICGVLVVGILVYFIVSAVNSKSQAPGAADGPAPQATEQTAD